MSIYQIDGFAYTNRERAKLAKKEKDGIDYIRKKTNLSDPDVELRLYNKLLDENIFETEVGTAFLKELQQELLMVPYIMDSDIRPIPVKEDIREKQEREAAKVRQRIKDHAERSRQKEANRDYKKKFQIATFFCAVFAAALVGIFIITFVSGTSPTIFNYEEEIINKYEAWEADLSERERDLAERENQFRQKIEQMQGQENIP